MVSEITSGAMQKLLGVGKVALNDLAQRGIVKRGATRSRTRQGDRAAKACCASVRMTRWL
jgi:hypothetical protein